MTRVDEIAVVGAGTAGLAAALLLARGGRRVTLFERVAEPGPVGAGIVLQPTGQAVLRRLGLFDAVRRRSARIDRLRAETSGRRRLVELTYEPTLPGGYGLGVHRGLLFEVLFEAATTHSDLDIRCGIEIDEVRRGTDGRSTLADSGGTGHGAFDLVVVADGATSELRRFAPGPVKVRPYAWGALWAIVEDPGEVYTSARELYQVVHGTRHMLGMLPCGRGASGERPLVTLYWSIRADAVEAFRAGSLQDFRATVCRYDPRAAAVLDQLGGTDELLVATYRDVSMKRHHGDGIVVIGDAAHAMSPQLGQGSNIALIDAATLADCLAVDRPVAASLSAYAARRRAHLAYYQWATRFLTPFFQSDGRGLGWLRDAFMPWAARVPWVRARMCGSMAGNLRGILGRPMSMPELTGADEPAPTRALEAGD